jgi:hypothetical protein
MGWEKLKEQKEKKLDKIRSDYDKRIERSYYDEEKINKSPHKTKQLLPFKIRERIVRRKLAEIHGYKDSYLEDFEDDVSDDQTQTWGESGYEFDEKQINNLIKDKLIKNEKELDKMNTDGLRTVGVRDE